MFTDFLFMDDKSICVSLEQSEKWFFLDILLTRIFPQLPNFFSHVI